jgi:hypothetical protein
MKAASLSGDWGLVDVGLFWGSWPDVVEGGALFSFRSSSDMTGGLLLPVEERDQKLNKISNEMDASGVVLPACDDTRGNNPPAIG